jgi:hypothetical protein
MNFFALQRNSRQLRQPLDIQIAVGHHRPSENHAEMIVVQISLRPVGLLIGAPGSVPGASQRIISAHNVEPRSKAPVRRRGRAQVSTFAGICRGC